MKYLIWFMLFLMVLPVGASINNIPTDPNLESHYEKIIEFNQVIAEGWLLNGERDQYWKFYNEGVLIREGHYQSGKKAGYWKYYNAQGILSKAGHYKNDLATAWWEDYNSKGSKIIESEYFEDRKQGLCIYYKNNRPYKAEKYNIGVLTTTWTDLSSFVKDNS